MNYRHIYHAGNFADVLKHAVFARLIAYLQKKDAAFRILDTHAGTGQYDLSSEEAQKTGEWQTGIGRLLSAEIPEDAEALLAPYLDAVRALNATPEIATYPGSPKLARMLMRRQDRLSLMELHEADFATLQARFTGDHQVRATKLDGWLSLAGHLPRRLAQDIAVVNGGGRLADLPDTALVRLGNAVNNWQVFPAGTEGYRTAEVTVGGVDTDNLSSQTMVAKTVPGLFFVGEVVDVTGYLGGYNFQWAWASGFVAGNCV